MAEQTEVPADARKEMTTTVTDLADLRVRIADWLGAKVGGQVDVSELSRPGEGGMSSISILFDATWDGETRPLVLRMPPDSGSFPVFPSYDLRLQYDVISAVAATSQVPVPELFWLEESPEALGAPFIVMRRLSGEVPTDNPPYVFFGWFFDATPEQRKSLQDRALDVLAQLHAIPTARTTFPMLATGTADALRAHVDAQREYYEWTRRDDGMRIPIIEETFDWLDANWPSDPGETVLSWGDARIGNMIFDDFTPVAVLDWEMAGLGPREIDVAWFLYIHRFFQDLAELFQQPGLPDVARRVDIVETYERLSGHTLRDFDWYLMYAGLRYAIVMSQVKRRMIHFGEDTVPATPDEYVMFHPTMRAMLDGTYDWTTK
ncbi:MAG TPA: phosphotransferase family protein [Jatrophihabitantaceae bacterium]|nr:phosphotransferase family protein [Jatrophihabitantaceae bacterium]